MAPFVGIKKKKKEDERIKRKKERKKGSWIYSTEYRLVGFREIDHISFSLSSPRGTYYSVLLAYKLVKRENDDGK